MSPPSCGSNSNTAASGAMAVNTSRVSVCARVISARESLSHCVFRENAAFAFSLTITKLSPGASCEKGTFSARISLGAAASARTRPKGFASVKRLARAMHSAIAFSFAFIWRPPVRIRLFGFVALSTVRIYHDGEITSHPSVCHSTILFRTGQPENPCAARLTHECVSLSRKI